MALEGHTEVAVWGQGALPTLADPRCDAALLVTQTSRALGCHPSWECVCGPQHSARLPVGCPPLFLRSLHRQGENCPNPSLLR